LQKKNYYFGGIAGTISEIEALSDLLKLLIEALNKF